MATFDFFAASDTVIRSDEPDAVFGSDTLLTFESGTTESVGLMWFDIFGDGAGQIATGTSITSATLTFEVTEATLDELRLHQMFGGWDETSTWNSLVNGVSTDGGEASFDPIASATGLPLGTVTIDVTASVQDWSNDISNYGWAFFGGADSVSLFSSEGSVQPVLTVTTEDATGPTSGTLVFQQGVAGYTGTSDTYIRENRPTTDYSANTKVYIEGSEPSGGAMQALLSFDGLFGDGPGQIPLGAFITSATLELDIGDKTNDAISFHRMLTDWDGVASPTWDAFTGGIQTDDVEAMATPTVTLGAGIGTGVNAIDVTESLQAWSDGEANHGWLISSLGEDIWRFASSESGIAPRLSVTYDSDPVPPPTSGTVTFSQGVDGYLGVTDTYLREGRPTTDYSDRTKVYIEGSEPSGGEMQALLSFQNIFGTGPGQIPDGSVITSATLSLAIGDSTIDAIEVYDVLTDWESEVVRTWDTFTGGIQPDGIEASSLPVATLPFGVADGFVQIDVTASAQAWANGTANHGWMIRSTGEDLWRFESSETINGPILTIEYASEPPPPPPPPPTSGTLTFEDGIAGYDGVEDTYIRTNRPTTDYSDAIKVYIEGSEPTGGEMQALLAFNDLFGDESGKIPLGATITSATLDLNIGDSTIDPVAMYEMLIDWDAAPDRTWDAFVDGIQTDGVEATAAPVATFAGLENGIQSIDVTASLQSWADGAPNEGWLFRSTGEDLWRFEASESGLGPALTVSYTLDTPPPAINLSFVAVHATTDYSADDPSGFGSGDPSGIAYVSDLDLLYFVDSEHNESPYFSPINLFAIQPDGTYVAAYSMNAFTFEPTGIAYDAANNRLLITDDDEAKIFFVDPANPTVSLGEIDLSGFGITDAEDPVVDPLTGHIFLLDGAQRTLFELDASGGFVDSILLPEQLIDPEALAYDAVNDVFFMAGGSTRGTIFQIDRDGTLLGSDSLLDDFDNPLTGSRPKIKGLEFAPSSDPNDGDQMSLYVANYGNDQVADGQIFEVDVYDDFQIV